MILVQGRIIYQGQIRVDESHVAGNKLQKYEPNLDGQLFLFNPFWVLGPSLQSKYGEKPSCCVCDLFINDNALSSSYFSKRFI